MDPASKSIKSLIDQLMGVDIQLPKIRREYAWSREKVCAPIDSIYRGYPSGPILLWRTDMAGDARPAAAVDADDSIAPPRPAPPRASAKNKGLRHRMHALFALLQPWTLLIPASKGLLPHDACPAPRPARACDGAPVACAPRTVGRHSAYYSQCQLRTMGNMSRCRRRVAQSRQSHTPAPTPMSTTSGDGDAC